MAAEFKIGRLRFTWLGPWTASTAYPRDSVVQYQGKTYVCLVPNTSSANFYADLYASPFPYWNLVVDGKTFQGTWAPSTVYSLGNLVIFGGVVYYANTNHTSTTFAADAAKWTIYTRFSAWKSTGWAINTAYGVNDVVKYGGIVYSCNTNHTSAATTDLGLEANQSSWTIIEQGIDYKSTWTANTRYKVRDVVKLNADLYICSASNKDASFVPANWTLWFPGKMYQGTWSNATIYQPGDVAIYGGYSYISNTVNNTNNTPSTDAVDWTLFNTGYAFSNEWVGAGQYKIGTVVRRHGQLFVAIADNSNADPAAYSISTTYTASGSLGTTLKVNSTAGISVGMNIINPAFTAGQSVVSVTNLTTLVISRGPDGAITDGASLSFVGVNYTSWSLLIPGNAWTSRWTTTTNYVIGDIALWQNGTYVCIQNHIATTGNRPDADTTNTYWTFYVPHSRKNALNTLGDIETYTTGPGYASIPIGTQSYMLKAISKTPTWSTSNIVGAVYYVCSSTGQDISTYGKTWDQPWKSIQYAAQIVAAGTNNPIAVNLLNKNKNWLTTEMWNWMVYQKSQSTNGYTPSSVFDETKTFRDASYVIDALAYDLARGGNSQIVAATLAYFAFGTNGTLFSTTILAEINYFITSLQFLSTLITTNCIPQTAPGVSYQTLNGVSPVLTQYTSVNTAETGASTAITSLMNILITALTTQSTLQVPSANNGTTATIFVKTGTYSESLPINVPENCAIVGDELRGVVVQPAVSITGTVTNINVSPTNTFTVSTTIGLIDQMPIQFVDPFISTTFVYSAMGGVTAGQTYYVNGSTITSSSFGVVTAPTVVFTGVLTSNSSSITYVSTYTNLVVGATITGNGIPSNTTISTITSIALTSSYTITISNPATISSSNVQLTQTGQTVTLISPTTSLSMNFYAGDCLKDMFRLRNGTGLRNMTLTGLQGTLGAPDAFYLQRPTGGSFACLDPGNGPNDTSVWIFRRSPYVQNVTAFGNGCAGYKVDGALHNGGNKSIVTNDFTHIVNDGIGIWCTGSGALTEAVSVFSYYGYSGYMADAGGRIRATNGNSSYGTYGCIATGYDASETPATGIIFNQSSQVQATVQQAYGTNSQLLRLTYANAGSNYAVPVTNMLTYSNNFLGFNWASDGNVSFSKVTVAPTGIIEGWTLTGGTAGTDGSYIYQNITIPSAGTTYTGLSAVNISGGGSLATFNVTITSTGYSVAVNAPGSGYAVYSGGTGSQLYIAGGQLGGVNSINDCIINVTGLSGSGISTISVSGTVPNGSALSYTCSLQVKQSSSPSIDLYAIFSVGGSNPVYSSINFNFLTGVVTPSRASGGYLPIKYGAINLQTSTSASNAGWYKIWFATNDTTGLATRLQYRVYPRGYTGLINQSTYVYAGQVELSNVPTNSSTLWTASTSYSVLGQYLYYGNNVYRVSTAGTSNTIPPGFTSGYGDIVTYGVGLSYAGSWTPSFYQEVVTNSKYTSYANFNISGSGTGVVTIADEVRSYSVFNTRIATDSTGVTGGAGYLTASNNAQAGTTQYIQLSSSDTNTVGNYTGMRLFINSGTGAGQYGYISYYDSRSTGSTPKYAYILKESFTSLQVTGTNSGTGYLTLGSGLNTSTLYLNQPVQFIPTYYTTSVTSTGLSQTTATASIGGTTNTLTVGSTLGMYVNMPLTFSGNIFSTVTTGYYYYIYGIIDSVTIQITSQLYGNVWQLSTVAAGVGTSMNINFPSNNSYLQASTTNMVVNYPIQFTGTALGGLSVGTVYYIQDIIDSGNFVISSTLVTISVTATSAGSVSGLANNYWGINLANIPTLTVVSTSSLVPMTPILFTNVIDTVVDSTKYYISNIINSSTFTIAASLLTQTVTQTASISNLITCSDTSNFQINQPIRFVGTSFDATIKTETTYYILVVNNSTTFTVSQSPGGQSINLVGGTGSMTLYTCPAAFALNGATGTMAGTTTQTKTSLSLSVGSMNGTFSTSLFGNPSIGQTYYVQSIPNTTTFAVSLATGTVSGTSTSAQPINLLTKTGSMNVAAVGWDHINPGSTIQAVLDNTSVYYIEPRTQYSAPPFSQTVATSTIALANATNWVGIAYGNGYFIAIPSLNTQAAYSQDGSTWTSLSLPSSKSWTGVAYGNGYWVAISSGGSGNSTAIVSKSNGLGWRSYNLPSATTWSSIVYGNGTFIAIANGTSSAAYSTNYGVTWTSSTLPSTAGWTSITYGNGLFVAVSSTGGVLGSQTATGGGSIGINTFTVAATTSMAIGQLITGSGLATGTTITNITGASAPYTITVSNQFSIVATGTYNTYAASSTAAAYSTDGITWIASTLPAGRWTSVAYGQGMFVTVSSTSITPAYSLNGSTWTSSNIAIAATSVTYGQGVFLALNNSSTSAYTSEDGQLWTTRTVTNDGYGAVCFGFAGITYNGGFVTLAGQSTGSTISAGCITKGRASVSSGTINYINEWEPGSGYVSGVGLVVVPTVTFTDPNVTTLAVVTARTSNGVLSSPTFYNRGTGYTTASTSVIITGNGFADTYQTGLTLILNNLTRLPSPGDDLIVAGVTTSYKVTSAYSIFNTVVPLLEANVSVSPSVSVANSVANGTAVSIRSKYSQVRLTNHDFLNIGYGDQANSNYPGYPLAGYSSTPSNQTVEANFGRVFYTSTDQDGNFKVGSLFGVQQATGIVTLSASQFGLSGLNSLSLGGISVGGSGVTVTLFSTDSTFTANSDAILPTQKAIKSYLTSRLSQGGSNTFTGQLTAGTVVVGGPNYIRSTLANGVAGSRVKMANKVLITGGVDGNMAALDFFMKNAISKPGFGFGST